MNKSLNLPGRTSAQHELISPTNKRLVIVGANGSGKSKLGEWMEEKNNVAADKDKHTGVCHRISAKRSLAIPHASEMTSSDVAEKKWLFGSENGNLHFNMRKDHRWGGDNGNNRALNDFEALLSVVFSQSARFYETRYKQEKAGAVADAGAVPPVEKIALLWNKLFPHRSIHFDDAKVSLSFQDPSVIVAASLDPSGLLTSDYEAQQMSDGERAGLYLIAQCQCLPRNSVVIVDEPEIHLHRGIRDLLWDEIEKSRPDCYFIYITHDLDFAQSRSPCTFIWVESYDGHTWKWQEADLGAFSAEIPDALKLLLLGCRSKVLFVEGTTGSLDKLLYRYLFPGVAVIPRESCGSIKMQVRSLEAAQAFVSHVTIRGLIDRDRMQAEEIAALEEAGIFTLEVAEVENLLCLEGVITRLAKELKDDPAKTLNACRAKIKSEFRHNRDLQIAERAMAEIKFRLNGENLKCRQRSDIRDFSKKLADFDCEKIYEHCEAEFDAAEQQVSVDPLLGIFNRKGLYRQVATCFGVTEARLLKMVEDLLQAGDPELLAALRRALPRGLLAAFSAEGA